MNKQVLDFLAKIYEVRADWNGNNINMWRKGWFSNTEPKVFRVNCNDMTTYYFNDMRKDRDNNIQVDVYKRDFVPTEVHCRNMMSSSSSQQKKKMELYELKDSYLFTAQLNEQDTKFVDVGLLSKNEILDQNLIDDSELIFKSGLKSYGFGEFRVQQGGQKDSNVRFNKKRNNPKNRENNLLDDFDKRNFRIHKYDIRW